MSHLSNSWKISVLALALNSWLGTALAAPAVTVRFGDLNLQQPQAISTLYTRLQRAAASVCGEPLLPQSRLRAPAYDRCVATALDQAVKQVDRAALTAYHRSHSVLLPRDATLARR